MTDEKEQKAQVEEIDNFLDSIAEKMPAQLSHAQIEYLICRLFYAYGLSKGECLRIAGSSAGNYINTLTSLEEEEQKGAIH